MVETVVAVRRFNRSWTKVIANLVLSPHQPGAVDIRTLRPSDLGWVVQRHGAIYAQESGWDTDSEALVAQIVAKYHTNRRPRGEQTWIAEVDSARAGCVFCCQRDDETALLRVDETG